MSAALRRTVAAEKAFGYTVPAEFGGAGASYGELAAVEEALAANGLGPLAVEISGQLTIGAGSLLAYGDERQQRTFLPLVAEGRPMAFGLTEVGVGVNAKKIQAYVEEQADGSYRLFAEGAANKLWITNAVHGGLDRHRRAARQETAPASACSSSSCRAPTSSLDAAHDYEFRCEPSRVAAFVANFNSRLHFRNFPIAEGQPHSGRRRRGAVLLLAHGPLHAGRDGGRLPAHAGARREPLRACSAAASAGRSFVTRCRGSTSAGFSAARCRRARSRICRCSRMPTASISPGLRDLTKSAAAGAGVESMLAAEHVLGGRAFHGGSRVNDARVNLHLFGVVEGEDDLILMGMVRDVTQRFVDRYLSSLLGVIDSGERQRATAASCPRSSASCASASRRCCASGPQRSSAAARLLAQPKFWAARRMGRRQCASSISCACRCGCCRLRRSRRYRALPRRCAATRATPSASSRMLRWSYLGLSLFYQLELTRAQIPLQRFGKCIEHLVSMLAICHHAALGDETMREVAALQAQLLQDKYRALRLFSGLRSMQRTRRAVADVGASLEAGRCSLIDDIEPQPFGHPWER